MVLPDEVQRFVFRSSKDHLTEQGNRDNLTIAESGASAWRMFSLRNKAHAQFLTNVINKDEQGDQNIFPRTLCDIIG
jgi:hypothetical protein